MLKYLWPSLKNLTWLTLITGIAYPLFLWAMGALLLPSQAKGSLVERNGVIVGSLLIGQEFLDSKYFQGRPSMTGSFPYNPMASGGSNYAGSNPAQKDSMVARRNRLCLENDCSLAPPPRELLEASASGLDPEISLRAARFQVRRIAKARGISEAEVAEVIKKNAIYSLWNLYGTDRVNVLQLNLALDQSSKKE